MKTPDRPRVIANFALTADGKITTRNHSPSTFTSPVDKARLREIRSFGDGILVGAKTVAADAMTLRLRDPDLQARRISEGKTPEPLPVILSRSGRVDWNWKAFRDRELPIVVISTPDMPAKIRNSVPACCDLWILPDRQLPVAQVLRILKRDYRLQTMVCEGGPTLMKSLLAAGALDELYLTFCPRIFGGTRAPGLLGFPGSFFPTPKTFALRNFSSDCEEFYAHFVAQTPGIR